MNIRRRNRAARVAALLGLSLLAGTIAARPAAAAEGMWTLDNVPLEAIRKELGFKPDSAWLERVRLASVRLAGGCSGSFVSPQGLVMTNHHCITSCLADLSTPQNDVLADGFLAADRAQEKRCAGTEINQLTAITDVTDRVQAALAGKQGEAFAEARRATLAAIENECSAGNAATRCDVVTLYQGGQYHLYTYRRYQDVRLAFAPEAAIAAFGGDPDNFNFPRYSLDMALLRVYGADGKPLSSPDYFPWSAKGAQAGDPVFVTGHPGSTSRLDTLSQLTYVRDTYAPEVLAWLSEKRGRLIEFGRRGAEEQRQAAEELQGVENSLKVWTGRRRALTDPAFFDMLVGREVELRQRIAESPAIRARVGDAYGEIEQATARQRVLSPRYYFLERGRGFDSVLFGHARRLIRAADELPKADAQRLPEYTQARLPGLRQRLANPAPVPEALEVTNLAMSLDKLRQEFGTDNPLVRAVLKGQSPLQRAEALVSGTRLDEPEFRMALLEGGAEAVAASNDPMLDLARTVDEAARAVRTAWEQEVEAPIEAAQARIAAARFELFGNTQYPDATFSLRLSYGQVKGWAEEDTGFVDPFTTYEGLYDRVTGAPPFDLPERWEQARDRLDLSTPYNAATTNDVIGGNSGSPALNTATEVVGLIFDGNIHSLAGDFGYEGDRNRAIMVDVRGMTEALRTVYRADHLLKELGLSE